VLTGRIDTYTQNRSSPCRQLGHQKIYNYQSPAAEIRAQYCPGLSANKRPSDVLPSGGSDEKADAGEYDVGKLQGSGSGRMR
jgi:hypothetical protein